VKEVKHPNPTDSYDFPDLSFHVLYHHQNLVGIIELIGNEEYVIFHLVHLAPESLFGPNYFSSIKLFTELSRKFEHNIIKQNLTLKFTSIIPAKKKFTSSVLVSNSFTPNSPPLPASPAPPPRSPDVLDELLKLREVINVMGDGNCTVYAIMSQLYPLTYGRYRLSPIGKINDELTRRITLDKDVQAVENQEKRLHSTKISEYTSN
jgi:hypothetical protein